MGEYLGNHLRGGQAHPQVQPSHPAHIPSTIPSISCVLAPGTPIHPLFRPCPAVMAPLCEGYQRPDHLVVSGSPAFEVQDGL